MRRPILRQLLVPMLLVVVLSSAATAVLAAWLGMRAVRQGEQERLQQLADTLTNSGFPLTDGVLRRMSDLSGARFATLDSAGAVQHVSLTVSEADRQQLAELPVTSSQVDPAAGRPLTLTDVSYRAVRIPVRTAATPSASSLVILTPETRWDDLAARAATPPLAAGLIAATLAALLAAAVARGFVTRIHSLGKRAALLAEGEFDQRPLSDIDDELRDLAVAMNVAAEKLKRYEDRVRRGERLQTLGRLGAGMAHQLRNAITGARMALDLHTSGLNDDDDQESLGVIRRQLTLMEAYLQRFLKSGRGEKSAMQSVSLGELATEALQLVEPMCRHHGIVVSWRPPGEIVELQGDAEALRQLILNLLINAIEALQPLPVAERKLTVELESRGDVVRLRIWDCGRGPAPEISGRLFEPFVTDKPDGTGLGLAVAHEIAAHHGGSVGWFREGERTCFEVTLNDGKVK